MKCIATASVLVVAGCYSMFGQAAQTSQADPAGPVILNILPVTGNLDQAEQFYHRLLGLESNIGDPRARLVWYPQAPFIDDMYGVKGNNRNFFLRVPGSDLTIEITQSVEPRASGSIRTCRTQAQYNLFSP
jgi:hypothetical protein